MEVSIEDTEAVCDFVSSQNLKRNDKRIRDQIRIDSCVEDLDCSIVRCREEEGESSRESD